ncbi:MAG: hypothetical protein K2J71_03675 [Oscillospiraceae bacterium]|nr:hypothetical protein [Oscillospiraceae bacterium]
MRRAPFPNPDWWERSRSLEFFGYNNGDGTTSWYLPDGSYDSDSPTPSENKDAWKIWSGDLKKLS